MQVVAFAKKTGDYAVLSQTDMSVIALTCQYELEANGEKYVRSQPGEKKAPPPSAAGSQSKGKGKEKEDKVEGATTGRVAGKEGEKQVEDLVDQLESVSVDTKPATDPQAISGDGDDDSDDAGDWITPSNVSKHRSKDLGLLPSGSGSDQAPLAAACMTGDYAVQNVLLSMGLGLIGEAGKRINKVKSFILRCHACFK